MEAAERRERTPARPRDCKASCIEALVPLSGVLPVLPKCMGLACCAQPLQQCSRRHVGIAHADDRAAIALHGHQLRQSG